jgi:NADPH:quinone reductase
MRAAVSTGDPHRATNIAEVGDPVPSRSQAVVHVVATSLNFYEARTLAESPPGSVRGWDVTGVVVAAAADGTGPGVGTRVVGFVPSGAWAELAAVETVDLAEIPDEVSHENAATLPTAGATAWQSLQRLKPVEGCDLLITGATGGVGRFAVELASRLGANVTASFRDSSQESSVRGLGAAATLVGTDALRAVPDGSFDAALDPVGGGMLVEAARLVSTSGRVVSIGEAGAYGQPQPAVHRGAGTVERFQLTAGDGSLASDLARLTDLIAQDQLHPHISQVVDWSQLTDAAQQLLARQLTGKVVLRVSQAAS